MAKQILEGFFGAEPITATSAEELFPSNGKEIRALVRELTDLRFTAWMSRIGHQRPGVAGGPGQPAGPSAADFTKRQRELIENIHSL